MCLRRDVGRSHLVNQAVAKIPNPNERDTRFHIGIRFGVEDAFAENVAQFAETGVRHGLDPALGLHRQLCKIAVVDAELFIVR